MNLLQPYLPEPISEELSGNSNVSSTGGYAQGGSLYALGLIHGSHAGSSAEKRKEACEFIRKHLRASHANEVISHGAALGVGLTSLGSADFAIINELKELLYTDSAVAGEAAAIAIGMVLVGSGAGNMQNSENKDELIEFVSELKNYARETQHEKIIRGIAISLALINYGQEENADALIEEMRSDRDPILRYGAQYAIALAYIGTGSNKAIRILLHTAVSDVNDDVRMAAVLGLAFVLYKTPNRVPQLVKLLLESFNPHVRYASCMAVGISMAGSGDSESISLLEPMLDDMTDFVRQGALMGIAMIYMQQSDICYGKKIRSFRERLSNIVKDKHQSAMTKMGAVLAKGIIDAGGRNVSIILGSRNGFTKMTGAIGVTLWLQHWHWYPMLHMFSLAVAPTFMIGLNHELKYPRSFEILCESRPSLFMYPKQTEEKKEERKKRVETVTLSTTAKSKARLARKKAKEGGDESLRMEIDESEFKGEDQDEKKDMDLDEEEPKKKKRESEQTSYRLRNPTRITKAQAKVCEFITDQRYRPIRTDEKPYGVVILTDSTPDVDDDDLAAVKAPSLEPEGECAPPEPFEWSPEELNVE
jgi:26S proteasome regulatory subunit N2